MKKNRIYCMATALALLGGACSSDTFEPGSDNGGNGVSPDDGVYVSVNFTMPSASKGTRSFTDGENSSNNGVEIGKDSENKVTEAVIVLAKQDNSFIAYGEVASNKVVEIGTTKDVYKTTSSLSKSTLDAYYRSPGFSRDIRIFVFCNPVAGLKAKLKDENTKLGNTEWYNWYGEYTETGGTPGEKCIWGSDKFLMSNSAVALRTLPATMTDWNNYSTESNPFDLSGVNNAGRPNEVDNYNNGRGNIKVERTAARFDFRDGSIDGIDNSDKTYNGIGNQTYEVVLDADSKPLVNVKLGKMSLVNMNNRYYFLKRVSTNGLDAYAIVCGPEMPWYTDAAGTPVNGGTGNFVVDAWATWKNDTDFENVSASSTINFGEKFNYPFFNPDGTIDNVGTDRWATSLISSVLGQDASMDDNNMSWNPDGKLGEYKIWRYGIENTIPGQGGEKQKYGVSTGIVFKGQMLPSPDAAVQTDDYTKMLLDALKIRKDEDAGNSYTDPILYQFGGHLYITWEHLRKAALAAAISDLKWNKESGKFTYSLTRSNSLYAAVFGKGGFGEITFAYNETDKDGNIVSTGNTHTIKDTEGPDDDSANSKWEAWNKAGKQVGTELDAFRTAATTAKISIYQSSYDKELGGWGYYCYYYYWNRHNNNGNDGIMAPMEFAVVRNNVYKLAVTKISRLGHPRISDNDPDKPKPNTDDEQSNVYFTVQCEALPWVVRVNNIEF